MGRAKLACVIARDAVDRVLYGRYTGTPQVHLDRISESLGRRVARPGAPAAGTRAGPGASAQ
jgi:hypothetical protein